MGAADGGCDYRGFADFLHLRIVRAASGFRPDPRCNKGLGKSSMSSAAMPSSMPATVASENLKITDVSLTIFEWALTESVTYTRMTTPKGGKSTLGLVTIH